MFGVRARVRSPPVPTVTHGLWALSATDSVPFALEGPSASHARWHVVIAGTRGVARGMSFTIVPVLRDPLSHPPTAAYDATTLTPMTLLRGLREPWVCFLKLLLKRGHILPMKIVRSNVVWAWFHASYVQFITCDATAQSTAARSRHTSDPLAIVHTDDWPFIDRHRRADTIHVSPDANWDAAWHNEAH